MHKSQMSSSSLLGLCLFSFPLAYCLSSQIGCSLCSSLRRTKMPEHQHWYDMFALCFTPPATLRFPSHISGSSQHRPLRAAYFPPQSCLPPCPGCGESSAGHIQSHLSPRLGVLVHVGMPIPHGLEQVTACLPMAPSLLISILFAWP